MHLLGLHLCSHALSPHYGSGGTLYARARHLGATLGCPGENQDRSTLRACLRQAVTISMIGLRQKIYRLLTQRFRR